MRIFDLHSDTLRRCMDTGEALGENSGQLDLKRGNSLGEWVQTFACFLSSQEEGEEAFQRFLGMRKILMDALSAYPEQLELWSPDKEPTPNVCQAVLSIEGGQALAGKIDNVSLFRKMGVRFLTLVWNGDNELASGSVGGMNRGLTAFGEQCLYEMERCGIIVDISHLNDLGIADVFSIATRPVMATHSNLRSVQNHPRNLTEEQFSFLAAHGGLCGLNFYPAFVNGEADYAPEAFHRHLDRMLCLGGAHTVALGSDFDGADMPSFLKDVTGLYTLYSNVVEWYGEEVADQLFYRNAAEFTRRNLQ